MAEDGSAAQEKEARSPQESLEMPKLPRAKLSPGEEELMLQIRLHKLPSPVREARFCPPRKWRFDFCWPNRAIAIEVEGGQWSRGRHQRPKGFENDCEKYNQAALMGYRVGRFTTDMVSRGEAIAWLREALR